MFKPYCTECDTWHTPQEGHVAADHEDCDCLKVVDVSDDLHRILAEALAQTGGTVK